MSARPVSTGARAPAPRKHTLESVLSAGLARLELERGVRATAAGEGGGEKQSGKEAVVRVRDRVRGVVYETKDGPQMWNGFHFLCEHAKQRSRCKECGGISICEHGRQRHGCKECGGLGICDHGRRRRDCKQCGGNGICEHGRNRSVCKDCVGRGICEHGNYRTRCKECCGKNICEHGRQRYFCKECGGLGFCEHGKRRSSCKNCGKRKVPSTNDTAPAPEELVCHVLDDCEDWGECGEDEEVVKVESVLE